MDTKKVKIFIKKKAKNECVKISQRYLLRDIFNMRNFPQELKNTNQVKKRFFTNKEIKELITCWLLQVKNLNAAGRKISPNLMMFCIKNKIFKLAMKKNEAYIFAYSRFIRIRNQDYFAYKFLKNLKIKLIKSKKKIHKKILKSIFSYDNELKYNMFLGEIEVRHDMKDSKKKYRTDIELKVPTQNNNDIRYIIEYFEKKGHHPNFDFREDRLRLTELINQKRYKGGCFFLENI